MSGPNHLDETGAMGIAELLEARCFIGAGDFWALTGDETGANLPDENAPWRLLKPLLLTGSEADEQKRQR